MTKEIKQEDLWDWICSQIGFNKKGKEIQRAIKKFIEGEKEELREKIVRYIRDELPMRVIEKRKVLEDIKQLLK